MKTEYIDFDGRRYFIGAHHPQKDRFDRTAAELQQADPEPPTQEEWDDLTDEEKEAAVAKAAEAKIAAYDNFAKTLRAHALGILAYYDYPISTGPLEGTNNKIKTMKRQAYGFRDPEFLRLKILGIHETKYALVG